MSINLDEIWPQERDLMIRPERFKYIRKIVKPKGCVFCTAYKEEPSLESLMIYKSEQAMVVLNKYPYNNGHILILPSEHCGDINELAEDTYAEISWLIRECFRILRQVYTCEGLNMGLNHGAVAGAGIPGHIHWHIIPRWNGDTNFFPLISETKLVAQSLEDTYDLLLPEFSKLIYDK